MKARLTFIRMIPNKPTTYNFHQHGLYMNVLKKSSPVLTKSN